VEIVDNVVAVEIDSFVEVVELVGFVVDTAVVGPVVAVDSAKKDLIASAAGFDNCGKQVAGTGMVSDLLDCCTNSGSLPAIVVGMDYSGCSYLKMELAAEVAVAAFVVWPAVAGMDYSLCFAEAVARDSHIWSGSRTVAVPRVPEVSPSAGIIVAVG
jgi:hypothetical protein